MNITYKGNKGLKGYKSMYSKKKSATEYLYNGSLIGSHRLKIKLIQDGIKEKKCENCNSIEWNGEEISLELHHIDGNRFNNELSNLKILCPNCHSKTPNYNIHKGLERKVQKEKVQKEQKHYFCSCGKEIDFRSNLCPTCDKIRQRKVKDRPSKDELILMIKETSLEAVGRKYNVSGNAVKKWLKN